MRQLTFAIALAVSTLFGQSKFEVASIKPSDPGSPGASMRFLPGGELIIQGMTIRNLIQLSYDIRDYQLTGVPNWVDSEKYDIDAKPPKPATGGQDEQKVRMKALLADRFQFRFHREARPFTVYNLTIAKTGSKLQAVHQGDRNVEDKGSILPVSMFAMTIAMRLDRPVIDKTGLTGNFYFRVQWTDDNGQPGGIGVGNILQRPEKEVYPSVFTAVQEQLGLKLEPAKAPVDVLLVDHIEEPPAN